MWTRILLQFCPLIGVGLFLSACDSGEEAGSAEFTGLDFEGLVRLEFGDVPTFPSDGGLVAWDRENGVIAFVDRQVPYEIIVFSEDGEPLEVVGQRGDGPGEYDQIGAAAYDGQGRLWVISRGGMRGDVLTPDREVERSFFLERRVVNIRPLGGVPMLAVTDGGEGEALAYLRADGSLENLEWGLGTNRDSELIAIATDGTERYWVAMPDEYRVFFGDVHGNWRDLELAEPEWFGAAYPPAFQEEFRGMLDMRGAMILLLEYDPDGDLLWITSGVPVGEVDVPRFREALESGDPEVLRGLVGMLIDHVVVGVDANTGTVVGDGRFDLRAISWASPWQYEVGDDHDTVVVTRPTVVP